MQAISRGIHATVYSLDLDSLTESQAFLAQLPTSDHDHGKPGYVAVKVVNDEVALLPPHDVIKEIRLLKKVSHDNITSIIHTEHHLRKSQYQIYMPLYPSPLSSLLDSPFFTPRLPSSLTLPFYDPLSPGLAKTNLSRPIAFKMMAATIAYQLVSALAYLHTLGNPIAHRDVKPTNIMLDCEGNVRLVDFGIAVEFAESGSTTIGLEQGRRQTLQVGAEAYRAPELLFGIESYDPLAIDIWALGITLSSLYTPLQQANRKMTSRVVDIDSIENDDDDESYLAEFIVIPPGTDSDLNNDEDEDEPSQIITLHKGSFTLNQIWKRQCIVNGDQGDLGLAWSIFRFKGTPNKASWPDFETLPDANKISFFPAKGVPLKTLLPFLHESVSSRDKTDPNDKLDANLENNGALETVKVLEQMLDYTPGNRIPMQTCLDTKWMREGQRLSGTYQEERQVLIRGFWGG